MKNKPLTKEQKEEILNKVKECLDDNQAIFFASHGVTIFSDNYNLIIKSIIFSLEHLNKDIKNDLYTDLMMEYKKFKEFKEKEGKKDE